MHSIYGSNYSYGQKIVKLNSIDTQKERIESSYRQGHSYYKKKLYLDAIVAYQVAAEQGHVKAMYSVGIVCEVHHNHDGISIDFKKGLEWYEKAAAFGHLLAAAKMAAFYESGEPDFLEPDKEKAVFYLKKTLESNAKTSHEKFRQVAAARRLKQFYEKGEFVVLNPKQANHYMEMAKELDGEAILMQTKEEEEARRRKQ